MRRKPAPFAFVVLVPLATSCVAFALDEVVAAKICEDQSKIESYEGTFAETGLVPDDPSAEVLSRVRFRAPSRLVVEVLEPERYRGEVLAWVGSVVHAYSPRTHAGFRLRGVPAPDVATWREHVREGVRWSLEAYGYREGETTKVAGRETVPWTVTPREKGDLRVPSRWWMDAELSFPLGVELDREPAPSGETAAGLLYRMRFREIAFNKKDAADPTWDPPADATWLDWDLGAPTLTREAARALADFPLLEPTSEEGLVQTRIVRATTRVVPIVALAYEKRPYFVSVVQTKDRGVLDPQGLGLTVALGPDSGRIRFMGTTSVLTFARKGVSLTLVSNLPVPRLLRFARRLEAP